MNRPSGINEKNRGLLESLNRPGKKLFSIEDAADILKLDHEKARFYLAYFARRGWLARVKRGLYISVPLGTVNPQEYKENPWIVANRIFAPCYIGGWSAAEHWGFTEQIFNSVFVFSGKVFRNKHVNVQGTDYVLKLVRRKNIGHTKNIWLENVKVQISDPTWTIVDMLDDPSCAGGIRHAAEIIKTYCSSEHFKEAELLAYLAEKNNRTVYKRLGFILESLNIELPGVIKKCRGNISLGYSMFDPSIKGEATFNRRWNLKVNTKIEA